MDTGQTAERDRYDDLQQLSANPSANIKQIRAHLEKSSTLLLIPNEHGIYSAAGLRDDDASGYQHAWLRDNVMIAYSKWFCGDSPSAFRTVQGLQRFLYTQTHQFQEIIARPELKEDVSKRPGVRFNARTLTVPGKWANAQNDSLGAVIWLRFLIANEDATGTAFSLAAEEWPLYELMLQYLNKIQFWCDPDSGAWEEERKFNSSSVGAVLAGLREFIRYGKRVGERPASALLELATQLYDRGLHALETLPFESPPKRKSDAALLLLIFPYGAVDKVEVQDQILSLVRARLMGPYGIRRYIGDSYYCQDYDAWFSESERTADFSTSIEYRDELLVPGQEAQWCLFDPLISAIYGLRSREQKDPQLRNRYRQLQTLHFQRSIRQLTKELHCPELYYSRDGRYVPNHHTPLAWTQANLSIALQVMERANRRIVSS
jgi:hypothetical protein